MRNIFSFLLITLSAGCSAPQGFPSLAPRATEAIDPRVPIASEPSPGTVDPAIAAALRNAVEAARGGTSTFNALARRAEALAAAAGPRQSESWTVAQQALSTLSAQHGVTTNAAANIDAIAAERIDASRWIVPAAQAAIEAAAAEVGTINEAQNALIARLAARLGN